MRFLTSVATYSPTKNNLIILFIGHYHIGYVELRLKNSITLNVTKYKI